jgi:hypothetical protein
VKQFEITTSIIALRTAEAEADAVIDAVSNAPAGYSARLAAPR